MSYNYFPQKRLPRLADFCREFSAEPSDHFSFTDMFDAFGVSDFRRKSVRISQLRRRATKPRPC